MVGGVGEAHLPQGSLHGPAADAQAESYLITTREEGSLLLRMLSFEVAEALLELRGQLTGAPRAGSVDDLSITRERLHIATRGLVGDEPLFRDPVWVSNSAIPEGRDEGAVPVPGRHHGSEQLRSSAPTHRRRGLAGGVTN